MRDRELPFPKPRTFSLSKHAIPILRTDGKGNIRLPEWKPFSIHISDSGKEVSRETKK